MVRRFTGGFRWVKEVISPDPGPPFPLTHVQGTTNLEPGFYMGEMIFPEPSPPAFMIEFWNVWELTTEIRDETSPSGDDG